MKRYIGRPVKRSLANSFLYILGSVFGGVYKVAFGGLDELLYKRARKQFIAEIELSFHYLFLKREGAVVPIEGTNLPRAFDYVGVTIAFSEVRFRIIRGRGELRVQAALPNDPSRWEDIELLWSRQAMRECGNSSSVHATLSDVAGTLDRYWDELLIALESWR